MLRLAVIVALALASGSAPWCLVTDSATRCVYYSLADCQRDAKSAGPTHGTCIPNPKAER